MTSSKGGGYRVELFRLAVVDGMDITYVGGAPKNGPPTVAGVAFPQNHEGYSGETIAQIDSRIQNNGVLNVKPNIILLHIGTNDMYGSDPTNADKRLGTLLDHIIAKSPDALIVVSNIIPLNLDIKPGSIAEVPKYNAKIPAVLNTRIQAGKNIVFVDQYKDFPISELGDNIHPNDNGYIRMAKKWYTAIKPYLVDVNSITP